MGVSWMAPAGGAISARLFGFSAVLAIFVALSGRAHGNHYRRSPAPLGLEALDTP
jgi:hypothetical protein